MKGSLLIILAVGLVAVIAVPLQKEGLDRIRVSTSGPYFLDNHNRVRLFHGTNQVEKGFPWYPAMLFDEKKLDDLQNWGFNIFRLGTMWSGVEPQRDHYNQTYVDTLKTIVKKLADRGIYTMLDMHQDVMSSLFKGYDGIPHWLVKNYPEPPNPYPWPLKHVGYWEEGYATQAASEGFEYFYTNYNGSIDKWVDFWGFVAENFKDDPAVIGYDPMNEPWIGDYINHPELLLPGVAGKRHLLPAYDRILQKIRKADKEGIFFFEPMIYGQAGEGDFLGSGFDRVPGGSSHINTSSYNFHMYCWALEFIGQNPSDEEKTEAKNFCDNVLLPQMLKAQEYNTKRIGGAPILTEFGLCRTFEDEINVECRKYMDLCDEYFVSWVQWDMNWLYGHTDKPNMGIVKPHVRAYPQAIAGTPRGFLYDDDTLDFKLDFTADPKIKAPTEIFVPSLRYTKGYDVAVSVGLKFEAKENMLFVYNSDDVGAEPLSTVVIKAKVLIK